MTDPAPNPVNVAPSTSTTGDASAVDVAPSASLNRSAMADIEMLAAMAAPGFLVDENCRLTYASPGAAPYLRSPATNIGATIDAVLAPDLLVTVSKGLRRVFADGLPTLTSPIMLNIDGARTSICVHIHRLKPTMADTNLAVVALLDFGTSDPPDLPINFNLASAAVDRAHDLQEQLHKSRESLQICRAAYDRAEAALQVCAAELRQSELLLKTATESASVGIATIDHERRVILANEHFSQLLDLGSEVIGKQLNAVAGLQHVSALGTAVDQAFHGLRVTREIDRVNQQGDTLFLNAVFEPVFDANNGTKHVIAVIHDISSTRVAAARNAESEERLRLANEAAGVGAFAIDAQTGVAHYSAELTTMLGFPGATVVRVDQAFSRIHKDDQRRVRDLYEDAQKPTGNGRLLMEFRFVRPGGEIRWLTWNGRFEFCGSDGARRASRALGVCVDVTERKKVEADLRASEARYRSVVEGSLQGIIIQQDEKIVYANRAMATVFGFKKPQDLIGKSVFDDFVAPEEREMLRARTRAAYEGQSLAPHSGWRGLRQDGQEIWVSAMAHLAEWQGRPSVVSFYLDITARKISERRLNETLRLMKVACAAGRMGTWHFDPHANKFYYSGETLELLGLKINERNRSSEAVEAVIHPDDVDRWRKTIAVVITSQSDLEIEFRVLRADGSIRWMLMRGHAVAGHENLPSDGLGVIVDITARKHAEERRDFLIQELDHRVKNSLANLQIVIERTSEQAASLDEFKKALQGRLMSMAATHTRLSKDGWIGVDFADIVADCLVPYEGKRNTITEGPRLVLNACGIAGDGYGGV